MKIILGKQDKWVAGPYVHDGHLLELHFKDFGTSVIPINGLPHKNESEMGGKTNWLLLTLIITVCKVISANIKEGFASLLSTLFVGVCVG